MDGSSESSPHSVSPIPPKMVRKNIRKCERYCCLAFTYFPLVFVYSLTGWAVWVEALIGFTYQKGLVGPYTSVLGIALYILLAWSYTAAVFTSPGTTTKFSSNGYESLPTQAPPPMTSFTVKSTGTARFCKKCNSPKPDRAHHCSTCKTCVLKMDHHCPWLATCVGFRNYKAFLLFLIYTSIFCWVCFAVSGYWVWKEMFEENQYMDTLMPINYIMLAVVSAVVGLALTAFTAWHISLALYGQTHIECLEKTRYLSPIKRSPQAVNAFSDGGFAVRAQNYGQQLGTLINNAPAPGQQPAAPASPFQGPQTASVPYRSPQRQTWEQVERQRARDRYEDYLDECDSAKMPHAFDLGWKRNLAVLFGPSKLLWFVPVCNSVGDGWSWEPSPKWLAARDKVRREREEQLMRERNAGWGRTSEEIGGQEEVYVQRTYLNTPSAIETQHARPREHLSPGPNAAGRRSPMGSKADRVLGREQGSYHDEYDNDDVNLRRLSPSGLYEDEDNYDTSSDEGEHRRPSLIQQISGFGQQRRFGGPGRLGQGQVRKSDAEPENQQLADDSDGVD